MLLLCLQRLFFISLFIVIFTSKNIYQGFLVVFHLFEMEILSHYKSLYCHFSSNS